MIQINNWFNKKLKGTTLKSLISFIIIVIFISPLFIISETTIPNINFPQISDTEISIFSPENRTYTKPMTGYYPSSYGFENYKNGAVGLDIAFFNEYYSPGSNLNTDIRVVEEELDGHCNYLNLRDSQSEDNTWAIHYIENPQSIGTIEFYNRFKSTINGSPLKRHYLYFQNSNKTVAFCMECNIHNGNLNYYDGFSYKLIANVNADTWYHHKIIFNCNNGTKGTFIWIVGEEDGTEINRVNNIDFENNFTGNTIDEICFETQEEDYSSETMWDAFGFGWDPNYNIGENLKEGLFLSFRNTTILKWMGYSLNGEANRTIFRNTTIPFPTINGIHKIQIFGIDIDGNNYESDVRYFTFNMNDSERSNPDIPIVPIILILSVVGISIPSSYMVINYEKKKRYKKKIEQTEQRGIKNITKTAYSVKKIKRKEQNKVLDVEKFDKKLTPIPQTISIDEIHDDFTVNEIETHNLESLKELCNEWVDQCTMHKEKFEGLGYKCFNCHTIYCVKCAYTLAEKNIGCIVCGKLIPIVFQKKETVKIKNKNIGDPQYAQSIINRIFESENLIEEINKGDEINLTFFERDFFKKIDGLELDETEKQAFISDMQSLTPKERIDIINNIISKSRMGINNEYDKDKIKTSFKILNIEKIFGSENLLEEINKGEDINLTFFEKDFFKKIKRLQLNEDEKKVFLMEMAYFTPKERDEFIKELWREPD